MENIISRIKHHFSESIQTKITSADTLLSTIADASQKVVQSLLDGHKIMSCGNGGSACNAIYFSANMINRFKHERPSLPAMALNTDIFTMTAIANDQQYNDIFAKQVRALGHRGDVLLTLSTSGNSSNLITAAKAAQDRGMTVIALTGHDGGRIVGELTENDLEVRVPSTDKARIQEIHLLIIHSICDIVDFQLFGHGA